MRHIIKTLAASVISIAAATSPAQSQAKLVFTFVRTGDNTATMIASGSLDADLPSSSFGLLGFDHATSLGNAGAGDSFSGDFSIGGVSPSYAYVRIDSTYFGVGFGDQFLAAGSVATGSLDITLDTETWADVGTSSTIFSEFNDVIYGSYSIVAPSGPGTNVPEPGSLALLALGLAGLAFNRPRKAA